MRLRLSAVTDEGLATLCQITSLTDIDLAMTDRVTDAGLQHLGNLLWLRKLRLNEMDNVDASNEGVESGFRGDSSWRFTDQGLDGLVALARRMGALPALPAAIPAPAAALSAADAVAAIGQGGGSPGSSSSSSSKGSSEGSHEASNEEGEGSHSSSEGTQSEGDRRGWFSLEWLHLFGCSGHSLENNNVQLLIEAGVDVSI